MDIDSIFLLQLSVFQKSNHNSVFFPPWRHPYWPSDMMWLPARKSHFQAKWKANATFIPAVSYPWGSTAEPHWWLGPALKLAYAPCLYFLATVFLWTSIMAFSPPSSSWKHVVGVPAGRRRRWLTRVVAPSTWPRLTSTRRTRVTWCWAVGDVLTTWKLPPRWRGRNGWRRWSWPKPEPSAWWTISRVRAPALSNLCFWARIDSRKRYAHRGRSLSHAQACPSYAQFFTIHLSFFLSFFYFLLLFSPLFPYLFFSPSLLFPSLFFFSLLSSLF